MKIEQQIIKSVLGLVTMAALTAFAITTFAGELDPPAAPAPTMKTLDEVEPRTPIPASATATGTFVINSPGSYYLTGDRKASGNGINVNADHVTIDLMGHSLIGPGSGTSYGVYMSNRTNVEIRNGTVRNFGLHGIYDPSIGAWNHQVIGVRAIGNKGAGIYLNSIGSIVSNCTVSYNSGGAGILTGANSLVTGNVVRGNQGDGIGVAAGSSVSGNAVGYNGYNGIFTSQSCIVTGNILHKNNSSKGTQRAGIRASGGCLVKDNNLVANEQNNIYVYGSDNVIEENLIVSSTNGIYFAATGNFYANNRASGNTTSYAGSVPTGPGDGGGNVEF